MNCKNNSMVQRGDIFYAALGETVGSEQSGTRPVLVIQNDIGNKYSPTVIVTVLTSKTNKKYLPTHVAVDVKHGVSENSLIMLEQIRTIDKRRLSGYVCTLNTEMMSLVDKALRISVGLED